MTFRVTRRPLACANHAHVIGGADLDKVSRHVVPATATKSRGRRDRGWRRALVDSNRTTKRESWHGKSESHRVSSPSEDGVNRQNVSQPLGKMPLERYHAFGRTALYNRRWALESSESEWINPRPNPGFCVIWTMPTSPIEMDLARHAHWARSGAVCRSCGSWKGNTVCGKSQRSVDECPCRAATSSFG